MSGNRRAGAAFLAASAPMLMVSLNNLVVTNALPEISSALGSRIPDLQWVVNGYILAFAGMLLTAAALGDRYGRRRVFLLGIIVFAVGSAACALAGSVLALVLGRVVQGIGAAAVQPLSLTLVTGAVPPSRRNAAIGMWGGVNGLGVALGPLVGGAVTEGLSWQWIFWVNVPVAVLAFVLVLRTLGESRGADRMLDLPGMALSTAAVTTGVWVIVHAGGSGWTGPLSLGGMAGAILLAVLFVRRERRARYPLLPLRFYRERAFVLSNVASLAMFFGVFGSIFFLSQYLQGPLGYSPLEAGLRTLPWTAMPMLVAPLIGPLIDRIGGGRLMAAGLLLQAGALGWIAAVARIDLPYARLVPALLIAGVGMGLMLAPAMAVVLGSVRPPEYGKASGANNTLREVGGALGVAVLTTIFRAHFVDTTDLVALRAQLLSPVDSAEAFVRGMRWAIWVGVAVVAAGGVAACFLRRGPRNEAGHQEESSESGERAVADNHA
ncbi:MFS transporter [Amycolatopsis pithecellobii]|uniref:DHA2 family efflux MFS transporter permease subunit n=1 Tax=Amycolatopsis pithecellobii TaxID=664692 RepID=A0A6N7ZAR8_9PSEU|nr:MFS transporter [Amycolatopsis pithecellobii]MTD58852.1 DHA2 family efflux MFS transporter permease subunit [Amycolatopsis pithecellobii]